MDIIVQYWLTFACITSQIHIQEVKNKHVFVLKTSSLTMSYNKIHEGLHRSTMPYSELQKPMGGRNIIGEETTC
jgi:hypothetical protein